MAASFATADAYRALHDTDLADARLQALLDRASRDVAAELRAAGVDYSEPGEELAADLADVCISLVRRAVGDGADLPFGASSASQAAAGFSASVTLANPYGDLFMTRAERRKLGLGRARAGWAGPFAAGGEGD